MSVPGALFSVRYKERNGKADLALEELESVHLMIA